MGTLTDDLKSYFEKHYNPFHDKVSEHLELLTKFQKGQELTKEEYAELIKCATYGWVSYLIEKKQHIISRFPSYSH